MLFFETPKWKQDYLRKLLDRKDCEGERRHDELVFFEGQVSIEELKKHPDAEVLSCFIYSKMTAEMIDALPDLKFIATMSTGFDHIDLDACAKRNIMVANVPAYGDNTVAEHAFSLILSLSRNVHKSYLRTLQNDFSIDDLQGFDLQGKVLGVVGCGRIGLHVIKIAKGFGMHVVVFDQRRDPFIRDLLHFSYVDTLSELLERSDIVTLHIPALPSTYHMIGKDQFAKMKRGALLINTARGTLVDTDALYAALKSGHLGGVGLDVIEGEELIRDEFQLSYSTMNEEKLRQLFKDKAIFRMDNVVFTPHNAFNSKEALLRILDVTAGNICAFQQGKPINVLPSASPASSMSSTSSAPPA